MPPKKSSRRSSTFPRLPMDSVALPVDPDLAPLLLLLDSLEDPRRDHLKAYSLSHVLALSVIGMLAECENWVEIADFGKLRQEWFASHGLFVDGTPSHDTLGRIFRLLDATVFARAFASLSPANPTDVTQDFFQVFHRKPGFLSSDIHRFLTRLCPQHV